MRIHSSIRSHFVSSQMSIAAKTAPEQVTASFPATSQRQIRGIGERFAALAFVARQQRSYAVRGLAGALYAIAALILASAFFVFCDPTGPP